MAEEELEKTGSPYHDKCFPPYCDDASPQIDKTVISKMDRDDLEDKYIVYADENLTLKKQIRNHERHIQRLQTALARQDNADKRGGAKVPASARYDSNRVDSLESQNKHLQAKINVLKQQLMNHSYIHSKENKLLENKRRLEKRDQTSPDSFYRDVGQTQSAREPKQRSSFKDDSIYGKDTTNSALKERIAVLEHLMETQKDKYKARISKLEKELAAAKRSENTLNAEMSEHSRKVSDNLEMIRLQRHSQEQANRLSLLSDQFEAAEKELAELRAALKQATENAEELKKQLERERERAREAQTHVTKSVSHTETIRALEEQIRDLQNEKKTLKDTNEQLLLLTSGSQTKSDRSGNESRLKKQISVLEAKLQEKIKELEEKEEELMRIESLMEETKQRTPQSTPSRTKSESPSRNDLIRENEKLRQQLEAVQPSDDEELKKELRNALKENEKLKKELKELEKQLSDEEELKKDALEENKELKKKVEKLKKDQEADQSDEEKEKLERKLRKAEQELQELRRIAEEHESCMKTISPVKSEYVMQQGYKRKWPDPKTVVFSEESSNASLQNRSPPPSVVGGVKIIDKQDNVSDTASSDVAQELPTLTPSLDKVKILLTRRRRTPYLTSENVDKSVSLPSMSYESKANEEEDWKKSPPPSQKSIPRHEIQEVTVSGPAQKPTLVIVSKHEFEAVLMKKKQYKSKTEVVAPASGKEMFNCKLEICVYDLEMDNQMMENLRDMDKDPQVFVEWNFVGLTQRTVSMPVSQALFCTNVAYFGPLSDNVADYVNERELPVQLWLEKSDGGVVKVASGKLDLSPAIQNPSRAYIRTISLQSHQGKATVYCAFKLHECCPSDSRSPAEEALEVSIGRLKLKKCDISADSETSHLYIEYSLLGHGGPELETDSMPRAEVMQFNYNKKLMVNEENAHHLGPLLEEGNPKSLRFLLLSEPCDLARGTEVEEIGHADLNLVDEMLRKDQDVVSAQLPVFDSELEHIGNLSVTLIGVDTIKNYAKSRQ